MSAHAHIDEGLPVQVQLLKLLMSVLVSMLVLLCQSHQWVMLCSSVLCFEHLIKHAVLLCCGSDYFSHAELD